MTKVKKSYGIICYRHDPKTRKIQYLMIKKVNTYSFCDFVAGKYKKGNNKHIIKLFNGMSYQEKMDILSLKFANMWYRIYHNFPESNIKDENNWLSMYLKKKSRFEMVFLKDSGIYLKRLINNSSNSDVIWEFPKGRSENNETNLETAIREFKEEISITDISNLTFLFHISPYTETYSDFGSVYKNTYYFCYADNDFNFNDKFNIYGNNEVSDVKWLNIDDINYMVQQNPSYKRIAEVMQNATKKIKSFHKKQFIKNIFK